MLVEANQMRETIGAVVGGQEIINHNVSTISAQEDKEYFNTYTHFGIHHEMLLVSTIISYLVQSYLL